MENARPAAEEAMVKAHFNVAPAVQAGGSAEDQGKGVKLLPWVLAGELADST